MLDHVDHVVRKFGSDYVAIGTDVAYTSTNSEREYEKVPKRRKLRDRWESFGRSSEETCSG